MTPLDFRERLLNLNTERREAGKPDYYVMDLSRQSAEMSIL